MQRLEAHLRIRNLHVKREDGYEALITLLLGTFNVAFVLHEIDPLWHVLDANQRNFAQRQSFVSASSQDDGYRTPLPLTRAAYMRRTGPH